MDKIEDQIEEPKSWIQKLKDESWQAELLVSTIAIFGSFQLFKVIDWAVTAAIDYLPPSQYLVGYGIVYAGLLGVSVLSTMFVIHFLLRAYWVGLVGLNSVFPEYSLKDSAYPELYTSKLLGLLPKLKKTIHDVDELSSVIFSAAFSVLMVYSYLSLVAAIGVTFYNSLPPSVMMYFIVPLILFGILLTFQMGLSILANNRKFRANNSIQSAYFKATKYGSIIMFGPLYKYFLQINITFGSNFKRKKSLSFLVLVFFVFGFTVSIVESANSQLRYLMSHASFYNTTQVYHGYYESKSDANEFLLTPQISSDIIESSTLRLFIPIYRYERSFYKELCDEIENALDRQERRVAYLKCYSEHNLVFLNDKPVETDFMKFELSATGQSGIVTYIDLDETGKGKNSLKVAKTLKEPSEWEIPFYFMHLLNEPDC